MTAKNHSAQMAAPTTVRPTVTTVDSIRNSLYGSVIIMTPRPRVASRNSPAHSQVAPWKIYNS